MPVYSRKMLRQTLGKAYVGDTVSALTDTAATGSFQNALLADSGLANQGLYANSWIRQVRIDADFRVATYNAGSGAYITVQLGANASAGDEFEIHRRLSGGQKDLMLDETLKRLSFQQEVGIPTGTAGQDFFSIENAASPNYITEVLDAYWFANPTGTLDRDLRRFNDIRLVTTATGREIRVAPAPGASAQLVLNAILEVTLGALSTATLYLPDDDRWLLAGAAANCYGLIIQNTPGQNAGELTMRRAEWARIFTDLSAKRTPSYARKIRLGEPEDETSLWGLPKW